MLLTDNEDILDKALAQSQALRSYMTHIRRLFRQRLQLFIRNNRRSPRLCSLESSSSANEDRGRKLRRSDGGRGEGTDGEGGDARAERAGGADDGAEGECSVHCVLSV